MPDFSAFGYTNFFEKNKIFCSIEYPSKSGTRDFV